MKTKTLILCIFAAVISAVSCGTAMTAEELAAKEALVEAAVNNHDFTFEVDTVYPMKGPSRISSDGYTLSVYDGVANTHLPFFGEVFMAEYGSADGGITLEDVPVQVNVTKVKNKYVLEFSGTRKFEKFQFILTVFPNGTADLSCTSNLRSTMRYSGFLKEKTENKD